MSGQRGSSVDVFAGKRFLIAAGFGRRQDVNSFAVTGVDRTGVAAAICLIALSVLCVTGSVSADPVVCRGSAIALRWTASDDPDITGYRVYRATRSGGPYSLLTPEYVSVPWFVDSSPRENETYVYVVTARDRAGNESVPSAEYESVPARIEPPDPVSRPVVDTDGDGLTDAEEMAIGIDPEIVDTDGDGLTDGEEVLVQGTDPAASDSDKDGVDDGTEIDEGTLPMDETDYFDRCDVNRDGRINAVDVQKTILATLDIQKNADTACDVTGDDVVNAADVQKVVNAVLGLGFIET